MKLVSWHVNGLRACLKKGCAETCAALDADEAAIRDTLAGLDYRYDPAHNRFI